jgi:hypothetical protein
LNKIENEKVTFINDNNRNIYKKMFNNNFNEENIFTLLRDFNLELSIQLLEKKITNIFSDENIRLMRTKYTDFRQRISKLYENIVRKNLTDL